MQELGGGVCGKPKPGELVVVAPSEVYLPVGAGEGRDDPDIDLMGLAPLLGVRRAEVMAPRPDRASIM